MRSTMVEVDITKHILVPKHTKLSDKEKKEVLESYNVTLDDLPRIRISDPAIKHLHPKVGDMIKVLRKSPTAGESVFYRGVIDV